MALTPARKAYVHLIQGQLRVNGVALQGGDAALIQGESLLNLDQGHNAEVLLFELSA